MLVDNLRPSVTAEFRVIASNRYGSGKPSMPSGEFSYAFRNRTIGSGSKLWVLMGV